MTTNKSKQVLELESKHVPKTTTTKEHLPLEINLDLPYHPHKELIRTWKDSGVQDQYMSYSDNAEMNNEKRIFLYANASKPKAEIKHKITSIYRKKVTIGTAGLSLVSPVFAGGDHHHDGEKKCKDNGDNNCNDTHKTQKIKAKNDCEIENKNKDHSHDNENWNELSCTNEAQNLKDAEQIFGSPDDGSEQAQSAQADSNQSQQ